MATKLDGSHVDDIAAQIERDLEATEVSAPPIWLRRDLRWRNGNTCGYVERSKLAKQGDPFLERSLLMTASVWLRIAQKVVLTLIGIMGTLDSASAVPDTPNNSGLTAEQCYRKDSSCTQFCAPVAGDLRYECFSICDRMLDHCLDTGDWTDSAQIDPGTGKPPKQGTLLSGLLVRQLMTLGDTDGDGVLSPKEIESLHAKVLKGVDANGGPKTPAPTPAPRD